MKNTVKAIITAGAVFGAISSIAYGAWKFGDYTGVRPIIKLEFSKFRDSEFKLAMDQAQQNTLAIVKNEFGYLQDKLKYGELTFEEKESRCKAAQILEYTTVEGCAPSTGTPDFIVKPEPFPPQ